MGAILAFMVASLAIVVAGRGPCDGQSGPYINQPRLKVASLDLVVASMVFVVARLHSSAFPLCLISVMLYFSFPIPEDVHVSQTMKMFFGDLGEFLLPRPV
jgi:hypothetical protein